MNTDFLDAHKRHWADAELLYNEDRWANADHLYGMAAECGLKRLILLFALDGEQTWSGYRVLFRHWNRAGKAQAIRERLQLVGAMIPDDEGRVAYFEGLRERAWNIFAGELYDEVPPGETTAELFSYEETDGGAPHYPWPIRWNRGFSALRSLHARLQGIDGSEVESVYGPLIGGVGVLMSERGPGND